MFKVVRSIISFALIILLVIGIYVGYVFFSYSRIEDNTPLSIQSFDTTKNEELVNFNTNYEGTTYNLGFGAYDPNYSFFMDEAVLKKNIEGVGNASQTITGKSSIGLSKERTEENTRGALNVINMSTPSFAFFQEIDQNSNRSYRVNQVEMTQKLFSNHSSVFASNFHTPWLQYPVLSPIGDIQSGILALSKYKVRSAERISLPITDAFPTKFFDLDRCLEILHLPIKDSTKELTLINLHLSAYDQNGEFKKKQLDTLYEILKKEKDKGNYTIVGGDFNTAFGDSYTTFQNSEEIPSWVVRFDEARVPSGFSIIEPDNSKDIGSDRDSSFPYIKGQNYETIIDGFIVSDNIEAKSQVIDTKYTYSDHNPVKISFKLKQD